MDKQIQGYLPFKDKEGLIEFSIQNIIEKELTNFENEKIYYDFSNNSIDEANNDSNNESNCELYKNIRSDYNCLNTFEITSKIENSENQDYSYFINLIGKQLYSVNNEIINISRMFYNYVSLTS